jgi:hypothetical protein
MSVVLAAGLCSELFPVSLELSQQQNSATCFPLPALTDPEITHSQFLLRPYCAVPT